MGQAQARDFGVVTGGTVARCLEGRERETVELAREVYLGHHRGETVNPESHFLRFPDEPANRIIALPAALRGAEPVSGIKWISSYPGNTSQGLPRASAVTVLNDARTGFPVACLEASLISAARTAASAALAARVLSEGRETPRTVAFVGTGLIALHVHQYLVATGWQFEETVLHDLSTENAERFAESVRAAGAGGRVRVAEDLEDAVRSAGLVVFATVSADPYVEDPAWFAHAPLVLHVSLRDLGTPVLLAAHNVVDDVEHVLRAGTSILRAVEEAGDRSPVAGTLAEAMLGELPTPADRTVVFSPFGLGVLDLALAARVLREAEQDGQVVRIPDFFPAATAPQAAR